MMSDSTDPGTGDPGPGNGESWPTPDFNPATATPRDWAAMYRSVGMQVVPARYPMVNRDDKRPALAGWREFQEALASESRFSNWFPPDTKPNMGVISGRASRNLLVIDLDEHDKPEAGFWWKATVEIGAYGIQPETWQQVTGGGGRQIFFAAPADWHVPTNKTGIGVDIRGQGGFAMLPPSQHLSGGTYHWSPGRAPWDCELADAPDWLLTAVDDLVAAHGGDTRGRQPGERVAFTGDDFDAWGARVDGREDALSRWAWRTVVEMHRETGGVLPEDRGESRFADSAAQWLRTTKTRLTGVDNAEGLERENRGATALIAKCRRALAKWDGRVAENAIEGRPAMTMTIEPQDPATIVPLATVSAFPFDPTQIPRRDWEVPGLLLRRHLSVLVAPPGSGKSLLTLQVALALACGQSWGGWRIRHPGKALVLNSEDDHDEMKRRLYGAAHVMRISQQEATDRVHLVELPEEVVVTRIDPKTRTVTRTPLFERLVATIRALEVSLVVVDPFAETFEGDENSNSEVKWAGIAWREIARQTGTSVWLVHHTRKYASGMAGDADASRGGGALVGTARIVSTLFNMTEEEATTMNVPVEERTQFVRFDDAKANLSLVTGAAKWFRKITVPIPNGTAFEPGDEVGALDPWSPPGILEDVSVQTIGRALDVIARGVLDEVGSPTGHLFTASAAGANNTRWAGHKLVELFGCDAARAKKILKVWLESGLLREVEYRDGAEGKTRKGLEVDPTKRPDRG